MASEKKTNEQTHIIDSDGEVMIVLRDPNTHFAALETHSMATDLKNKTAPTAKTLNSIMTTKTTWTKTSFTSKYLQSI